MTGKKRPPTDQIQASHILENPDMMDQFSGPYAMIIDGSFLSGLGVPTHGKMVDALNVLAARGWETVSICNDRGTMFALLRRVTHD